METIEELKTQIKNWYNEGYTYGEIKRKLGMTDYYFNIISGELGITKKGMSKEERVAYLHERKKLRTARKLKEIFPSVEEVQKLLDEEGSISKVYEKHYKEKVTGIWDLYRFIKLNNITYDRKYNVFRKHQSVAERSDIILQKTLENLKKKESEGNN